MKKIPFLRPHLIKKEDLLPYLDEIETSRIYSNFGPLNSRFEKRVLDEYFDNIGSLTTVNNATIGLILAILASKRPNGKYALMPSFTFAATPLAALWCGLEPFFIDIREDDWCIDEKLLKETMNKLGDQVAVVLPYATFGNPMDLTFYQQLYESGIPVVIDAAASFGATDKCGSFGKGFPGLVVYSFHATKSFGIGEGGLVYSGTSELISNIRQAENFGFSRSRTTEIQGLNGKLSEYSSAIALATLDAFSNKIKIRQKIYAWYYEQFQHKNLFLKGWQFQKNNGDIPYQFLPVVCPEDKKNKDIIHSLSIHNIEARTYFSPPCHEHPHFKKYLKTSLTNTEKIAKRIISLPLWEEMTKQEVNKIVEGVALS